jgi:hypothetical protein
VPRAGLEPGSDARSSQSLAGNSPNSQPFDAGSPGSSPRNRGSPADLTVTLSHDPIGKGLEDARDAWTRNADPKALRRALLDLLRDLEQMTT